jgi:hypothetical protein
MLAGDARLGFGRASMRQNKALALALNPAPGARLWNRQPFAPEDF